MPQRADYVDKVYKRLPFKWGDGQRIMADLGITQNQLAHALKMLRKDGRAVRPATGDYYPTEEE